MTIREAQELSGLPESELVQLIAQGVLRARQDGSEPVLDRDEFDAWRQPPLPERWRDLLGIPAETRCAGLDLCPVPARWALERFLRDVHTVSDPLIPLFSAAHWLRYVRYSASSANDLLAVRSWLLCGPASVREAEDRLQEEDDWE